MNKRIEAFCLPFLFTMILSCYDNKTNIKRIVVNAPISILLENLKTETSSMFDSIATYNLIYLQTSRSCVIGNVDKVIYFKNKTIIFDRRQKMLFIFNEKGNFLAKIDNIGRGPNQYIQINDFCVAEETNSIFALVACGGYRSKVFEYDFNGVIKNSTSLPFSCKRIGFFDNNLIFYSDFLTSNKKDFNIYFTTKNGEIISKFFPYKRRKGMWGMELDVFLTCKDQLYYYPVYCDTIYRFVDSYSIEPYIVLKDKEFTNTQKLNEQYQNISFEEFIKIQQESNYRNFLDLVITEKYLFFESGSDGLEEHFVYDLKNKKLSSFKEGDYITSIFASPLSTDGNWLVNIVNPYEVHDFVSRVKNRVSAENFIKFMDNDSLIKEVYEHSKPSDNPIIIKYKLI